MSEHVTTSNIFRYSDETGVLLEAPLVHLSSFLGLYLHKLKTESPDIEAMDIAKAQATAVNTEFGSKLMWWHIMEVTTLVRNEMLEIKKKNTCQEPELQQPTE
jgi:hypothetical protein